MEKLTTKEKAKKLFIIGNGFDVAHNLNSQYKHFRSWLFKTYVINLEKIDNSYNKNIPNYSTNYRGLEKYSKEQFSCFFIPILDECNDFDIDWTQFEESLANINRGEKLDFVEKCYNKEGDYDPFGTEENFDVESQKLLDCSNVLSGLFSEWARTLNDDLVNGKISQLNFIKEKFSNECLFLNFNYTDTIEILYQIKNVFHIHGQSSASFGNVIFGHGSSSLNKNILLSDELEYYNANDNIKNVFYSLKKDCEKIITKNKDFFEKLSDVEEIYIFGKKVGGSDAPYFKEIFKKTAKASRLYVYIYNKDEKDEIFKNIKSAGFNKEISERK